MRYILIKTDKHDAHYWNRCVVGLKEEHVGIGNILFYYVIALCDGDPPDVWAVCGQVFSVKTKRAIEVTEIYNKMVKLLKKLSDKNDHSYLHISDVIKRFKKGVYPTKLNFEYMNYIWKEIK